MAIAKNVRRAFSRCVIYAAFALHAFTASSEPWLAPGDSALRSDVTFLADAGILRAPITTWPLPWAEIAADAKDAVVSDLDASKLAALERVLRRARAETRIGEWSLNVRGTAAESPTVMRTFERTPRSEGEL